MTSITAVLHTHNDALRLGRCLETLYPCDNIVVVDRESRDGTVHIAREYGAQVLPAVGASPRDILQAHRSGDWGWILALDPRESLSESLAASLFEWKAEAHGATRETPCAVFLREETADGWIQVPIAQTRLVPPAWNRWTGDLPVHDPEAVALEGELLRFVFP
jgi:glycosyltransferase involved in cell wall biosynthesis